MVEKWDVYDRNGVLAGYTKTRDDSWAPDEYHLGASLWIVNPNGELLIQKRSPTKRRFPNAWSSVGGSVVSGESSREGCTREVKEEIGINVNGEDLIFVQRMIFPNTINDDYVLEYGFPIEKAMIQPEEVSQVKWASINEVIELYGQGLFMMNDLAEIDKIVVFINKRIGL